MSAPSENFAGKVLGFFREDLNKDLRAKPLYLARSIQGAQAILPMWSYLMPVAVVNKLGGLAGTMRPQVSVLR